MGKTIILSTDNIVSGSNNTKLVYDFPQGGYYFKDDQIALQALYQFFSIFNITTDYVNNSFSYVWFDGLEYSVDIPDGYYEISDLNSYFQSIMIANTHYMTNSSGQYIYFLEFVVNTSRYATQINSYELSTTIQSLNGYSLPAGATWSVPNTALQALFKVNTTGFGELLGYSVGSYPTTQTEGTISFLSSSAPQITPYSSILVSCSLVNNRAVIPSNILTSYTPLGTSVGSILKYEPSYIQFADIDDGQYTQITIEFRDQLNRSIVIQDPNMLISLYTKKKTERL
jgi:hypothetical protein